MWKSSLHVLKSRDVPPKRFTASPSFPMDGPVCLHPGVIAGIIAASMVIGAIVMVAALSCKSKRAVAKASSDATLPFAQAHVAAPPPHTHSSPAAGAVADAASTQRRSPGTITLPSIPSQLDDAVVIVSPEQSAAPYPHALRYSNCNAWSSLQEQHVLRGLLQANPPSPPLPQHQPPRSDAQLTPRLSVDQLQLLFNDLSSLKSRLNQLAFMPEASTAWHSADIDNSSGSPRRLRESSTPPPNYVARSSPRAAAGASPSPRTPQSTNLRVQFVPDLERSPQQQPLDEQQQRRWQPQAANAPHELPVARTLQLHAPLPASLSYHSNAAATPSRIARSSPPRIGSPSEVYVEISRLVAEAYDAVAPHLAQQQQHAPPSTPRKHAAATPPRTKSPSTPTAPSSCGARPMWRGPGL
jgi:hypothetical protein